MTTARAFNCPRDRLTPHDAVVLFIDHQIGLPWELDFAAVRHRVVGLATAARILGIPTVITRSAVDGRDPIIPELAAVSPSAPVIQRTAVNAWEEWRVRSAIKATGRTKLIVAGVPAEGCVVFTAISASAAGYDVYVVLDACGYVSQSGALLDVRRMLRAGVTVTDSAPVVAELMSGATHQRSRELHAELDACLTSLGAAPLTPATRGGVRAPAPG